MKINKLTVFPDDCMICKELASISTTIDRAMPVCLKVDFHEVHFTHLNQTVWLPNEVLVRLDWNGKRLRNRHEYSDYKVFDVDPSEKIGQPKRVSQASPAPQELVTAK